jgi:hypothetical protein
MGLSALTYNQGYSFSQESKFFKINTARPIIYSNGCHTYTSVPKKIGCDYGDLSSSQTIMLVGDSHAAQWFPGFEKASIAKGFRLRVATKSGCPALIPNPDISTGESECLIWQRNLLMFINQSKPDVVVISNLTEGRGTFSNLGMTSSQYFRALIQLTTRINSETKVAVIGDTPYPGRDSVKCLSLHWRDSRKCDLKNSETEATNMTRMVKNFQIRYFDSRQLLCGKDFCPAIINKKNVYRDESHLSLSTVAIQEVMANEVFLLFQ